MSGPEATARNCFSQLSARLLNGSDLAPSEVVDMYHALAGLMEARLKGIGDDPEMEEVLTKAKRGAGALPDELGLPPGYAHKYDLELDERDRLGRVVSDYELSDTAHTLDGKWGSMAGLLGDRG